MSALRHLPLLLAVGCIAQPCLGQIPTYPAQSQQQPTVAAARPMRASATIAHPNVRRGKAHLLLAMQYESKQDDRMAIQHYHRALEFDPTSRLALISFARLKHRISDLDGAIVTYRQSLKHHPNDALALNDLGLCYARSGEAKKALQSLTAASRLEPDCQRYANNLATVLVENGRPNEAVMALEPLLGEPIANFNVAMILHQRQDGAAAHRFAKKALKLDPSLTPAQQLCEMCGDEGEDATAVATNEGPALPKSDAALLGEYAPEPELTKRVSDDTAESEQHQATPATWNFRRRNPGS